MACRLPIQRREALDPAYARGMPDGGHRAERATLLGACGLPSVAVLTGKGRAYRTGLARPLLTRSGSMLRA